MRTNNFSGYGKKKEDKKKQEKKKSSFPSGTYSSYWENTLNGNETEKPKGQYSSYWDKELNQDKKKESRSSHVDTILSGIDQSLSSIKKDKTPIFNQPEFKSAFDKASKPNSQVKQTPKRNIGSMDTNFTGGKPSAKRMQEQQEAGGNTNWDLVRSLLGQTVKQQSTNAFEQSPVKLPSDIANAPVDFTKGMYAKKDADKRNTMENLGASWKAGTMDIAESLGGGVKYLGDKTNSKGIYDFGSDLTKSSQNVREGFDTVSSDLQGDFKASDLLNSDFYSQKVFRQAPNMATSVIGGLGAVGLANKMNKLKGFKRGIANALIGGTTSTAIDSTIEAGNVYNIAEQVAEERGIDPQKAFEEVWAKNFGLNSAMEAGQFALGLSKLGKITNRLGKVGKIGTKAIGGAGIEATQEGLQEAIQADALKEDFDWRSNEMVETYVISALMGGSMTGAMSLFEDQVQSGQQPPPIDPELAEDFKQIESEVKKRTTDKMNDAEKERFQKAKEVAERQGYDPEQAEDFAWENFMKEKPDGQERVTESYNEFIDEKAREEDVKNKEHADYRQEHASKFTVGETVQLGGAEFEITEIDENGQIYVEDHAGNEFSPNVLAVKKINANPLDKQDAPTIAPEESVQEQPQEPEPVQEPIQEPVQEQKEFDPNNVKVGDKVRVKGFADPLEVLNTDDPSMLELKAPQSKKPLKIGRQVVKGLEQSPVEQSQALNQVELENKVDPKNHKLKSGEVVRWGNNASEVGRVKAVNYPNAILRDSEGNEHQKPLGDLFKVPENEKHKYEPMVEKTNEEVQNEFKELQKKILFSGNTPKHKLKVIDEVKEFAKKNNLEVPERVLQHEEGFKKAIEKQNAEKQQERQKKEQRQRLLKEAEEEARKEQQKEQEAFVNENKHIEGHENVIEEIKQELGIETNKKETTESPETTYLEDLEEGQKLEAKLHPNARWQEVVFQRTYGKSANVLSGYMNDDPKKPIKPMVEPENLRTLDGKPIKLKDDSPDAIDVIQGNKKSYQRNTKVYYGKDNTEGTVVGFEGKNNVIVKGSDGSYMTFHIDELSTKKNKKPKKVAEPKQESKPEQESSSRLEVIDPSAPLPKVMYKETKSRISATFKPVKRHWHKEAPKQTTLLFPKGKKGKEYTNDIMLPKGKSVSDINDMLNINFYEEGVTAGELTSTFDYMNEQSGKKAEPKTPSMKDEITKPETQEEKDMWSDVDEEMDKKNENITKAMSEFKEAYKEHLQYMVNAMGQGVEQGNVIKDDSGEVVGRYGRRSKNPQWYRDFYRSEGKKPNQKELKSLAIEQMRNGFEDTFGEIPAWKPENVQLTDAEMRELDNRIANFQTDSVKVPKKTVPEPLTDRKELNYTNTVKEIAKQLSENTQFKNHLELNKNESLNNTYASNSRTINDLVVDYFLPSIKDQTITASEVDIYDKLMNEKAQKEVMKEAIDLVRKKEMSKKKETPDIKGLENWQAYKDRKGMGSFFKNPVELTGNDLMDMVENWDDSYFSGTEEKLRKAYLQYAEKVFDKVDKLFQKGDITDSDLNKKVSTLLSEPKKEQPKTEPKKTKSEFTHLNTDAPVNKYDKARDQLDWLKNAEEQARKRLEGKKGRMNSLPMDMLMDYAIVGASKLAHKSLDYAQFTEEMVNDFGEVVRKYMGGIYGQSQQILDSTPEEIDAMLRDADSDYEETTDNKVEEKPKQKVRVNKKKSYADMSTEELVDYVRSETSDTQDGYVLFSKYRNANPELDAKDFNRMFTDATPNRFETSEEVDFSPTHTLYDGEIEIQVTDDNGEVVSYTMSNGSTGSSPKKMFEEQADPIKEDNNEIQTDGNRPLEETQQTEVSGVETDSSTEQGSGKSKQPSGKRDTTNVSGTKKEPSSSEVGEPTNSSETQQHANETSGGNEPSSNPRGYTGRRNFRITDELSNFGKPKERFSHNIKALRLVKDLEESGRKATPEEQKTIAKYSGWGAIQEAFDADKWSKEYKELRSLIEEGVITQEEYAEAKRSTQYAHYTPKNVVDAMYQGLERLGFKGGRILEPAVATGNFFGLLPDKMAKSTLNGVERDSLSARIAKQLYQKASIDIKDFQDFEIGDGYFDIAIGNPPFSENKFPYEKGDQKTRLSMHNYFFMKSLDKLRDGGVLAFVTSSGTMNSKDRQAREMMAERADFLGAIRLPNTAFKENAGTEVTTDIIFFKKRKEGEKPNHVANFIDYKEVEVKNDKGEVVEVVSNEYFDKHPKMTLGKNHANYQKRLVVKNTSKDLEKALSKAIDKLPSGVYEDSVTKLTNVKTHTEVTSDLVNELDEGNYAVENGQLIQKQNGRMIKRDDVKGTKLNKLKQLIRIRDVAKSLLDAQLKSSSDSKIKGLMKELNVVYDKFEKEHGPINRTTGNNQMPNLAVIKDDPLGASLLLSLEDVQGEGKTMKIEKQAIFRKRVLNYLSEPTSVETSEEAMVVSLFRNGHVDLEYMAGLTNKSVDELMDNLKGKIYKQPNGTWVTADEYLSGNVRQKLIEAKEASENDESFEKNVKMLEQVIPEDVPAEDIIIQFGTPFIPDTDVTEFINEYLKFKGKGIRVRFVPTNAQWNMEGKKSADSPLNTQNGVYSSQPDGDYYSAVELIELALNNKEPRIRYTIGKNSDGSKIREVDQEATESARGKIEEMQEDFNDWLFKDKDRAKRLTRKYNDEYNSTVLREYDGSMVYGGDTEESNVPIPNFNNQKYTLRPHQKDAVWRLVQGDNTMLAHVVGAGKTLEMVVGGMEMKRLGLIQKPVYVVPNHLLEQWQREFKDAYPNANVLVSSNEDIPSEAIKKTKVVEDIPVSKRLDDVVKEGDELSIKGMGARKFIYQYTAGSKVHVRDSSGNEQVFKRNEVKGKKREMTDKEFEERKNDRRIERAVALNKIAVGDYDAVLITHKTFEKLPMSPQAYQDYIRNQLNDLELALQALKAEDDNSLTVKQLENAKESLEGKLKENIDEKAKDIAIPFEQLGIDQIIVDEAHMFKNLQFHTKLQRISGMSNSASKRAEDMFIKTQWLSDIRNGKGITFATGTPISNTMAEMFTMQRYLQMDKLRSLNISHFDAWANMFGELETSVEMDLAGNFKERTRFKNFRNIPELLTMFKEVTDIKTADMLDLPRPENVEYEEVISDMTPDQQTYMDDIVVRANAIESGAVDKKEDNWLKLTGDARKMSLDIRLVDPTADDDPMSKINTAVRKMHDIYKETSKGKKDKTGKPIENLAQLGFVDLGTPKDKATNEDGDDIDLKDIETDDLRTMAQDAGIIGHETLPKGKLVSELKKHIKEQEMLSFDVYNDIRDKLVQQDIPKGEIAFIHEANTKRKKEALFQKVKSGQVRIMLGSTEKMGAGMNVQDRLVALHHIDAPWRPSDVEQREGRMIRRGNLLDHVKVYTYVTKGSFDRIMWDILKRKAEFIETIMSGDYQGREVEDTGVMEFRFGHVQALAEDDTTILDKQNTEKLVNRLQNRKADFKKKQRSNRIKLENLPEEIADLKDLIKSVDNDLSKNKDISGENFSIVLNGKTFTKRKDASKYLEKVFMSNRKEVEHGESIKIGSMGGHDIHLERNLKHFNVGVHGERIKYLKTYNELSPEGSLTKLENVLKDIKKKKDSLEKELDYLKDEKKTLEERKDATFRQEDELQEATKELKRLNKILLDKKKDKQNQPAKKEQGEFKEESNERINSRISSSDEMGASALHKRKPVGRRNKERDKERAKRRAGKQPESPYAFEPEIEEEYQGANTMPKDKLSDVFKEKATDFKNNMTREFPELPNTGQYSALRHRLLELEAQRKWATSEATTYVQAIQIDLDEDAFDLFTRIVVLRDLKQEAQDGRAVPFNFMPKEEDVPDFDTRVKEALKKINQELKRLEGELQHEPEVEDALKVRKSMWAQIKKDYISAMDKIGVNVRSKLTKEDYFRHIVIEMAKEDSSNQRVTGGDIRSPKNSKILKERKGSESAILTDYIHAEIEAVSKMMFDIEVANTINMVDKKYNQLDHYKKQAKQHNEKEFRKIAEREKEGKVYGKELDVINAFREQLGIKPLDPKKKAKMKKEGKDVSAIGQIEKKYRQLQGMSRGKIEALAENGELWTGDNNEWEHVVEEFKKPRDERKLAVHTEYRYYSELADQQAEEGSQSALTILKYTAHKKKFMKAILETNRKYKTWEKLVPEGYEVWKPDESNIFYTATVLDEQNAEKILTSLIGQMQHNGADFKDALDKQGKGLVMAGKREGFVVPSPVAKTLRKHMLEEPRFTGMRTFTRTWKGWILLRPNNVVNYVARNLTGDIDRSFLNMDGFKHVSRATKELGEFIYKKRAPSKEMRDWLKFGGIQVLEASQEFGDIKEDNRFKQKIRRETLTRIGKVKGAPKSVVSKAIYETRNMANYSGAIFRYAHYLSYLKQMDKNKDNKPNNYGASIVEEIKGLDSNEQKAFHLSNDLLIAYNKTSRYGQMMAESLAPFWRFLEGNMRGYKRIFENAIKDDRLTETVGRKLAGKAVVKTPYYAMRFGKLALMVTAFSALTKIWNTTMFGEEEEELPQYVQDSIHVIYGRDKNGEILYFDRLGMLDDFTEWFGVNDLVDDVKQVVNNERTVEEVMNESVTAPLGKLIGSLSPIATYSGEALFGKTIFPDWKNPRPIHDEVAHLFGTVGMKKEYSHLKAIWEGQPREPLHIENYFAVKNSDPKANAYYYIRDEADRYKVKVLGKSLYGGGGEKGEQAEAKSEALYKFKQGMRFGDFDYANKHLQEYVIQGGTERGMKQSLRMMHPLGNIAKDDQQAFLDSLSKGQKEKLVKAIQFYEETLMGNKYKE